MIIRYTQEQIEQKIMDTESYIKKDYQVDNVQTVLERSKILLQYFSDIPALLDSAKALRDKCDVQHIDDMVSKRKILCASYYNLYERIQNIQKSLSKEISITQSQISTLRVEMEYFLKYGKNQE